MATSNRGRSSSSGNRGRSSKNNNPEGHNQYDSRWIDSARDRAFTAAATVGGAVAAGVFLWSRRNQITDQLSHLTDQISEWREGMMSDSDSETAGSDSFIASSGRRGGRKNQTEIMEEALTLKETGAGTGRSRTDAIG